MADLIPRLSREEMPAELAEMLRPRVERLGYLGEFFQCAAHRPKALMSFMAFTEDLKRALPDNFTEVVALTVASLMENRYERVQHERLCLKLGLGEAWVRDVLSLSSDAGGSLSEEERLVQRLVLAVVARRGHDTERQLEALGERIGSEKAVAVLLLIGRYVTHAYFVNCLGLEAPVSSPLEAA